MAPQLVNYINDNNLGESLQSAYKSHHSTESALWKVQNDILKAVDNRRTVVLLLFDLFAAFDTVYHGVLIHRLESRLALQEKLYNGFDPILKIDYNLCASMVEILLLLMSFMVFCSGTS